MDIDTLQDALKQHREELLRIIGRCERKRAQLQDELAIKAQQEESFAAMRPVHNEITDVVRDYWEAYGRARLIDQILELLQERRERLTCDDTPAPTLVAVGRLGPWARCAEETCPPFPPWA